MFKINKIVFYNYIPYFKEKIFEFGNQDGTSIIFGDNNIGKTSFIKGVRFLFFNDLSENPENHNFKILANINTKAFNEGDYEFFVNMDFTYNGTKYTFNRRYIKKSDVLGEPKSDLDFTEYEIIRTENKTFSAVDRKKLIETIIPKSISEFIFFDGENIKKYVEILNNDGQSGDENRRIKKAINNILGTPYLDRLIDRLEMLKSNFSGEYTRKVTQTTKDINLREEITDLNDKKKNNETALQEAKIKYEAETAKYNLLLVDLNNISKNVEIYTELTNAEKEKKLDEGALVDLKLQLSTLIQSSLKTLLFDKIYDKKRILHQEIEEIEEKDKEYIEKTRRSTELKKLVIDNICSLCGNHLSTNSLSEIKKEIQEIELSARQYKLSEDEKKLLSLNKKTISKIDELIVGVPKFDKDNYIKILQKIAATTLKIKSDTNRITNLKKELGESSGGRLDISKRIEERDKQKQIVDIYEKTINDLAGLSALYDNQILSKTKKIVGVLGLEELQKKMDLLNKTINQYMNVKNQFLVEMREKVESSANELFLRCVNGINDDIERVSINENYKMTIYLKSGNKIYQPSSGYNNLLALSLIYGLNKNSNLFGTIFFDAALSNLSNNYTNNIIKTLNDYAPQLIFLVHKDRLDINETRNILGTVINEFELYQENDSLNTKIRRI